MQVFRVEPELVTLYFHFHMLKFRHKSKVMELVILQIQSGF